MGRQLNGMIGLEVHAYLVTCEKLFCRCVASREKGLKKNVNICPICTGQPGAKPMLPNKVAVEQAVRIGLMLGCGINNSWVWQRKHYSWPDLPKGYQNTISGARAEPVGVNGEFHGIGIWSMHLEEDPASWDPKTGCIDYNRSGLPLVEIVTAPDFTSSAQVVGWLKRLIHSLAYLKAVDSNAGIKVDVNVNLLGRTERVEIKNISSIENIGKAIEFELERQGREGGVRETRRFDALKMKTFKMRGKEEEDDYRFISDPDLVDVNINKKMIGDLKKSLPESPEKKLEKMIKKYKIGKDDADVLTKHIDIAEFFEEIVKKIDSKFALPWVTVELLRFLNYNNATLDSVNLKVEHFVELLDLVNKGKITPLQAKGILNKFYPKSFSVGKISGKISDVGELTKMAKVVIGENAKAVSDFKGGDKNAFNFLMGALMKKTDRRADFKVARDVLMKLLK
jgi:aspartyl-tRNA(Asn)/glutamyl-tRNA(Gln) amidotransferase subunit B